MVAQLVATPRIRRNSGPGDKASVGGSILGEQVTIAMRKLPYVAVLGIIGLGGMSIAAAQSPGSTAPKSAQSRAAAVKIETHAAAAAAAPRPALAARQASAAQAPKAAYDARAARLAMLTPAKATGPKPVNAAIGKSTAVLHGAATSSARVTAAGKSANAPPRAASRLRSGGGAAHVQLASIPAKSVGSTAPAAMSRNSLMATPHKARRR